MPAFMMVFDCLRIRIFETRERESETLKWVDRVARGLTVKDANLSPPEC